MSRLSAVDVSDMDIDIDELVDARLAKATAEALENTHPLLTGNISRIIPIPEDISLNLLFPGGSRRRLRRTNAYTSFTADETDDNDIVPPNTPVDSDRPAPEDAPNQKQAAMTAFEHNIEDETNTDEVDTVRRLTTSINSDKPRDTPTVSDYDSQREDESGYASEAPQPPRIASQIIVEHSAPIGIPTAAPNSAHATIQSAAENAVQSAVQNGARSAAQNANQNFVIHHVAIPAPPNLVQATLNFGQNTAPTTCNTCGFVYMRNLHDEVRGHNEFHADFIGPVAVTKRIFNENASGVKTQEYSRSVENEFGELDDKSYFIGTINLKARKYYRETAEKVVDKIEKGLENDMSYEVADYECLKSADLWSKIKDPLATKNARQVPRFKVFIVIEKKLIISAAVVELITQSTSATFTPCTVDGYTVDSTHDIDGNPHTIMGEDMVDVKMTFDDPYKWEKAHVGVHYLWTHEDYRRCGHAARLMDFVRRKGFGTHILKEDVAYTQLNRDLKEFLLKYNTGHTDWNLVEWSVRLYDSEVKDEKLYV